MNRIWWNFNWAEFPPINGNFSFEVPSYSDHTVICMLDENTFTCIFEGKFCLVDFREKSVCFEKKRENEILTYHNIGCLGFIFVFGTSFRNWKFILGRDCSEYQNRKNFDIQKIVMTHIIWVICMSHQSKMISICWEAKSHCMNSLCQETRIILIGSNRDELIKSGHFHR